MERDREGSAPHHCHDKERDKYRHRRHEEFEQRSHRSSRDKGFSDSRHQKIRHDDDDGDKNHNSDPAARVSSSRRHRAQKDKSAENRDNEKGRFIDEKDRGRDRDKVRDRSRDVDGGKERQFVEKHSDKRYDDRDFRDKDFNDKEAIHSSSSKDKPRDRDRRDSRERERSVDRSRKRAYDAYNESKDRERERERSLDRAKRHRSEVKEKEKEQSRSSREEDGRDTEREKEKKKISDFRDEDKKDTLTRNLQSEEKTDRITKEIDSDRGDDAGDLVEEKRQEKRKFEDVEPNDDNKRRRFEVDAEIQGQKDSQGMVRSAGAALENGALEGRVVETSDFSKDSAKPSPSIDHPTITKVSKVLTTTVVENKADNIVRSDEVNGKPSTDGTSATAIKGSNLSLDALTKAKRALQIQKELSEKLKKLPQIAKPVAASSSSDTSSVQSTSASLKIPASTSTEATPRSATSNAISSGPASTTMAVIAGSTSIMPGHANYEAVKRAQELAAKLGFRQDPEFMPLISMFSGQTPDQLGISPQQKPAKAPVLRLDAQGREIDENGNVIEKPKITNLSTLKVNINKQKKDAFQILRPDFDEDPYLNPHFDPDMGVNKTKLMRAKRMSFQFVQEGEWSKQAEILKFKSQFGEAQAKELKIKQAQLAKAKAEPDINPNLIEVSERISIKEEKPKDPIPEVEWWDVNILPSGSYSDVSDVDIKFKKEKITIYVEHPQPIEPPAEPTPPPPQPLKLTKKERKKLRTQRRLAKEKDRQEMIRQGLLEPPKPKVKMSNLMKVLGAQATQDPTKLEMEIRKNVAEREQAHVDRNIARKLTPAERREKKERKLFDDPNSLETIVSVYKINDLSHPQTRFKVDINAQENRLTGCAVISDGMTVVVVEGCSKSVKRYRKLMLQRINWVNAVVKEGEAEENEDDDGQPANKCVLVWQGSVAKPCFNKFIVQQCRTEAAARKFFTDAGVGHYWDLASNFIEDH